MRHLLSAAATAQATDADSSGWKARADAVLDEWHGKAKALQEEVAKHAAGCQQAGSDALSALQIEVPYMEMSKQENQLGPVAKP